MHLKRKLFLCLILLGIAYQAFSAQVNRYAFYSTKKNPPVTHGEPPIEGVRAKVDWSSGYLLVRFPYQKTARLQVRNNKNDRLSFKIGVGNELQEPVFYKVNKIEVRSGDRKLLCDVDFYNEKINENQQGLELLKKAEIRSDPNMHGDLLFELPDWKKSDMELELEMSVTIRKPDGKKETLHPTFKIYQGYYLE